VEQWKLLRENAAHGVELPELPEGRTRYLSPTELKAVLQAAPEWMRAPVGLAAATGMRRGELLKLRWKDIDRERRIAHLLDTKNGDLRPLPLNELAMRVIDSLPEGEPGDPIMPGVDPSKLSVYIRRIFTRLKISDASFHTLRHTTASQLVMKGVDLYTVGKLLGHKTPRMTARYAHLAPQYLAGAAKQLDGVFGDVLELQAVPKTEPLSPLGVPAPKTTSDADEQIVSYEWRPQGDSNPCYRRERAVS